MIQNERLPKLWRCGSLVVRNVSLDDLNEACAAYNELNYLEYIDKVFAPTLDKEIEILIKTSLAEDSPFQMQTICREKEILGYYHVKHNFPNSETLYISMFFVRPAHINQSIGKLTIKGLLDNAVLVGYKRAWLKVSLLNWPAIRFWHRNGFSDIIEVHGDRIFTSFGSSSLVIQRILI